MARMIPEHGPHHTESYGERHLYSVLKSQLSDEYTVIHSLPWLCSAVSKVDKRARPTGEIDFLIIHPKDGVLALEVKSGVYRIENSFFVHVRNGSKIDPLSQTKKNIHGFASWLGTDPSLRLRIGYGFVFPDSDFDRSNIPGMYDTQSEPPQPLYIDFEAYADVANRIIGLMKYWKRALLNSDLGVVQAKKLIEYLAPKIDGCPRWSSRIRYDNKTWLQLTVEQSTVVRSILRNRDSLVTGWPGTGKTLVAIEAARKFAMDGKRVLVVSFNARLTEHIRIQLENCRSCTVMTWHGLCRQAASALNHFPQGDEWYKTSCLEDLDEAIDRGLIGEYDALLVDESQALAESWCKRLVCWFEGKPKAFFCDETQVFKFERNGVTLNRLEEMLGLDAFWLSIVLRMPKAVTEILSEIVPSKVQLSTPRSIEPDTFLEITTRAPFEEFERIKSELIQGGVGPDDIVVLTGSLDNEQVLAYTRSESLAAESIAKFRGLESPVVIVLGAEGLDTAELFSAYSRATTKFVAIYNVRSRYWKDNFGFQMRLRENPEISATVNAGQAEIRIRNMLEKSTSFKSLGLKSLDIWWAEDWGAMLIEYSHETQMLLWVSYLSRVLLHPIFIWLNDSRTKFFMVRPASVDGVRSGEYSLFMDECKTCCGSTPHSNITKVKCMICLSVESRWVVLDQGTIEKISLHDAVITSQLSRERTLQLQSDLPLEVAAVAALMRANKKMVRSNALLVQLPSGQGLYRTAFAFVQSRIAVWPSGGNMPVDMLADEIYHRYRGLEHITLAKWRSIVASAFATLKQKGFVIKVGKKLYKPIEDADAPVPKRYDRDE